MQEILIFKRRNIAFEKHLSSRSLSVLVMKWGESIVKNNSQSEFEWLVWKRYRQNFDGNKWRVRLKRKDLELNFIRVNLIYLFLYFNKINGNFIKI